VTDDAHSNQSEPIGYMSPPVASQYPKGRSGNPAGRSPEPKGGTTITALLQAEVVTQTGRGERRVMTRKEHLYLKLVRSAANGSTRAAAKVSRLAERERQIRRRQMIYGPAREEPAKPIPQIWREFAKAMHREARRSLVMEGVTNITDDDIEKRALHAIAERWRATAAKHRLGDANTDPAIAPIMFCAYRSQKPGRFRRLASSSAATP
jgi:hypothetical protein